jgi:putative endonuclease
LRALFTITKNAQICVHHIIYVRKIYVNPHTFSPIVLNRILFAYVLSLHSQKSGGSKTIGSTNDLRRRLLEHNKGEVESTKFRRPFELRYYEAFFKESDARKREHSLKKDGRVLGQLKRRISKSLQWEEGCGGQPRSEISVC